MSDTPASPADSDDRSWLDKIGSIFSSAPKSVSELLDTLSNAAEDDIIDQDAVGIFRGAISVADMQVRDIMIPRSKMVSIRADHTLEDALPIVIESAHSRFPVTGETTDQLLGILLAKDLLPYILQDAKADFSIESVMRPIDVVPETKRLNVLLREFRENRNHMAVVIDEFGDVAGLVTIEDVLEEIVGDIEDEFDKDEERNIRPYGDDIFIVQAQTSIHEFNESTGLELSDEEFDTIGGLVAHQFGHLPERGEETQIANIHCTVLQSDNRKIKQLKIKVEN